MHDPTPLETIEYHHSMLSDNVRTESYLRSILRTVRPGDIVLDVGTGTGLLAYFACMAGAGHVYAVEQGPVVELARQICRRNGFEDRVTFMTGWSTHVDLDEPVDVIVTETIGNYAFDEGILGWIADARRRLLADGGRIIPHTLGLVVVPVDDPDVYTLIDGLSRDYHSIDVSPARSMAASRLFLRDVYPKTFLSEPQSLARVELDGVTSGTAGGEVSFVAKRDGILYGIGGWFESELAPGISLSNAPPNPAPSWKHGLLPLDVPLPVRAGDHVHVRIRTEMRHDHCHWWWRVKVDAPEDSIAVGARPSARFAEGTTFSGETRTPPRLPGADQVPARSEAADVDLFVLQSMDGETLLGDIASRLAARYPARFRAYEDSLRHVQALAADYT